MKGKVKLTTELAEIVVKMLAAGMPRKQIVEVTGVALPQISTIAIMAGISKHRPKAKAMAAAAPLPAEEKGKE